jgi:hypothetical protein
LGIRLVGLDVVYDLVRFFEQHFQIYLPVFRITSIQLKDTLSIKILGDANSKPYVH